MKRSGFTMIELIFVIVILGILAAVALPKFIGVSEEAQVSKLKSYVGTLNRTVAPALWSKSISSGKAGKVATDTTFNGDLSSSMPKLENLDDEGSAFSVTTLSGACGSNTGATLSAISPGDASTGLSADINNSIKIGGKTYGVGCVDGNMSSAPQFFMLDVDNTKLIIK